MTLYFPLFLPLNILIDGETGALMCSVCIVLGNLEFIPLLPKMNPKIIATLWLQ